MALLFETAFFGDMWRARRHLSLSLSLHGLSCACSLDFKFRLSLYIFIPRPRCPKSRAVAPSPTDSVKQTDQEWEREKCSALLKVFRSIDTVRWCVQRNYTGWQREDSFGFSVCWHRSSLKLKATRWNYTRKRWPVDCVSFFWVRRTKSFFDFVSNLETLFSRFYLAYHDRNIFFKEMGGGQTTKIQICSWVKVVAWPHSW